MSTLKSIPTVNPITVFNLFKVTLNYSLNLLHNIDILLIFKLIMRCL